MQIKSKYLSYDEVLGGTEREVSLWLTEDDPRYYLFITGRNGEAGNLSFPLRLEEGHRGNYNFLCEILGEEEGEEKEEEEWGAVGPLFFRERGGLFIFTEGRPLSPRTRTIIEVRGIFDLCIPLSLLEGGYIHLQFAAQGKLRAIQKIPPWDDIRGWKLISFYSVVRWKLREASLHLPLRIFCRYYDEVEMWSPLGADVVSAEFYSKVGELIGEGKIKEIRE